MRDLEEKLSSATRQLQKREEVYDVIAGHPDDPRSLYDRVNRPDEMPQLRLPAPPPKAPGKL